MKLNIYPLLLSALLTGAFSACDYNEHNFDNFEEETTPKNVGKYEYTFLSGDVSTIVTALRANKTQADSLLATAFNADKMFSEALPASTLIPYLLKSKYIAGDVGSSAQVTYEYNLGRDSIVTGLSTSPYVVSDADYKLIWGELYPTAFTPDKSPETSIPTILKKGFVDAKKGTFKNVEYYYSSEEPVDAAIEEAVWNEDFQKYDAGSGVLVNIDSWINKDLKNNLGWQNREYSNNKYAQVSAYKTGLVHDVRLITKVIDLTSPISNPQFSFDIVVGNFTVNSLSIELSENFDGKEANIASATWKDVTSSFTIPQPASGYSTWASAGTLDLKKYIGKKVYISFRYIGDDTSTPKKTTTYQIDNVKVYNLKPGVAVKKSELVYASYEYNGTAWSKTADTKISLQPTDYTTMGVTYLSTAAAPQYLSKYLKLKFPYAQDGASKVIIYKTSKTACYADTYVHSAAKQEWAVNNFIETRTDQFVFANVDGVKQWIFDPTFESVLSKADFQLVVEYVRVNQAVDNPKLYNTTYKNAEYYYGFSANYPNITYRDKDRTNDPLYPISGSSQEKEDFCNKRTVEGLQVFLGIKYPDATPLTSGVVQMAKLTVPVYSSHISTTTTENWTYTFECTGNKEWKFIQRESKENKTIEKAGE